MGSGKVSRAAILGLSGGVWAASPGYSVSAIYAPYLHADLAPLLQLTLDEQKAIRESFSNPDKALTSGIKLAGQKFFTLQANDRSVYVKKGVWFRPT